MFGIFDENINEMPVLVASLNQWGASIETDRSMLQERVDAGFAEIRDAVLQLRGQVLTQSANTSDVENATVRLDQRMEQVEQIGKLAMTELANLMNGYQHKFVDMEGAILALAASAESNLKARQGQLVAELQHKFLELGGNDESVKAAMSTLLARVASLENASARAQDDPWQRSRTPWSGGAGAAPRSSSEGAAAQTGLPGAVLLPSRTAPQAFAMDTPQRSAPGVPPGIPGP